MAAQAAVGIDVGGTKTQIRVDRGREGAVDAIVPTTDWWTPGTRIDDPANLDSLVALLPGRHDRGDGDCTVLGAHGIDSDLVLDRVRGELETRLPGRVHVVNDALLAGPAAGFGGSSVAIIAGTGSIVVWSDSAGRVARAGGHGFLLGDEGAAPSLVRDLARALLRADDRGQPDAVALALLADAAGVPDCLDRAAELSTTLHANPSHTAWGALAPAVFAAADAGSHLAAHVIDDHADELAQLALGLVDAHGLPQAVVLAGGVVTHQARLADAIGGRLQHKHPQLPVVVLREPPVAGAVALARVLLAGQSHESDAAPAASDVATTPTGVEGNPR